MNPKERILAALKGKETDRICWSPNPAYWWEAQDDAFVNKGEYEFLVDIGADPIFRGHYPIYGRNWDHVYLFNIEYKNCKINDKTSGFEKVIEYETPVGTLDFCYKYSESGNTWFLNKFGVKTPEDFKVLTYIMENITLTTNYSRYKEETQKYGNNAVFFAQLSPFLKSSFQSMIEYWVGTEEIVYAVADYPNVVEEALEAMKKVNLEAVKISAGSSAEIFTTFEDTSTTNTSPQYYKKYIMPEIKQWCAVLHETEKMYIQHACGHLNALMPLIAESGIDGIESISPPPTGNIELWDAKKLLPENIALIGGIEPTVFLNSDIDRLEEYVINLLNKMKGSRFILANSDSCPPGVEFSKFQRISKILRK